MSAGIVEVPIVSEGNQTCKPTGFSRGYLTSALSKNINEFVNGYGKDEEEAKK